MMDVPRHPDAPGLVLARWGPVKYPAGFRGCQRTRLGSQRPQGSDQSMVQQFTKDGKLPGASSGMGATQPVVPTALVFSRGN